MFAGERKAGRARRRICLFSFVFPLSFSFVYHFFLLAKLGGSRKGGPTSKIVYSRGPNQRYYTYDRLLILVLLRGALARGTKTYPRCRSGTGYGHV